MLRKRVESADEDALTNAVVDVVAAVRGEEPTDITFRLYDYLDPKGLELLSNRSGTSSETTWEIHFAVEGVDVTIRSGEHVAVVASSP